MISLLNYMKIIDVSHTVFPEVEIVRFARFSDGRGFFSEIFRKSDFQKDDHLNFLKDMDILQANISYSKRNVIRGLHFQWNPPMGKLVRTIQGRMIDLFLDVRPKSANFGKIAAYEMSSHLEKEENQWIWIPVGFAHGVVFLEDTILEYFCSAEYNPSGETTISPMASDIDWSLCDKDLKLVVDKIIKAGPIVSEKDRKGHTVTEWKYNPSSSNLTYPIKA